MNDRIRELAFDCYSNVNNDFNTMKFAELIIKECSEYLWGHEDYWTHYKERRLFEHYGIERFDCKHEWVSAVNKIVKNGSVCLACGDIDAREPYEITND